MKLLNAFSSVLSRLNRREPLRAPHANLIWIWEDARVPGHLVLRLLLGESKSLKPESDTAEEKGRARAIHSELITVGSQVVGEGLQLELHPHCVEISSTSANSFDLHDDIVISNMVGVIARQLGLAILPGVAGVITDIYDYERSNKVYGDYWPPVHELMTVK